MTIIDQRERLTWAPLFPSYQRFSCPNHQHQNDLITKIKWPKKPIKMCQHRHKYGLILTISALLYFVQSQKVNKALLMKIYWNYLLHQHIAAFIIVNIHNDGIHTPSAEIKLNKSCYIVTVARLDTKNWYFMIVNKNFPFVCVDNSSGNNMELFVFDRMIIKIKR